MVDRTGRTSNRKRRFLKIIKIASHKERLGGEKEVPGQGGAHAVARRGQEALQEVLGLKLTRTLQDLAQGCRGQGTGPGD